ncbi:hypothetical protein HCN51_22465 [Nonomuraea sp. FMUSA5-5]|uniref:Antitoxin n=1 Tax=Nonomuraea composti TaxID=2720023 RepID=A0ABX1B6L2_9ACTN|nr:hypothetical protein [Nonomuraea sp. FMUSA5-5]NJP92195.1 hypothetical protein [Nonomuraea sp. FMUSA5-5]
MEIVFKGGYALPVAADEYETHGETAYLLQSPANARRLMESYHAAAEGRHGLHELLDDE